MKAIFYHVISLAHFHFELQIYRPDRNNLYHFLNFCYDPAQNQPTDLQDIPTETLVLCDYTKRQIPTPRLGMASIPIDSESVSEFDAENPTRMPGRQDCPTETHRCLGYNRMFSPR